MARNLAEQKSLLAKLLAQEDLNIVYENIPTPFFDLKTRSLHCPILKDMGEITEAVLDLFMSHEIGHALFTPFDGWHDAIFKCRDPKHVHKDDHDESCYDMKFKDFINVADDARIESKMKRRFPGLREPYLKAYKYLHQDVDIFACKDLTEAEINALPIIDRINLYFKIGNLLNIHFDAEEQKFVDALSVVEKFDEMVVIARSIYKYQKEHKTKNLDDLKSAKDKMSKSMQNKGIPSNFDKNKKVSSGQGGEETDDENRSLTDRAQREIEKTLKDDSKIISVQLPEVYLDNIIRSTKDVYSLFIRQNQNNQRGNPLGTIQDVCRKSYNWFSAKNRQYVDFLVKQFLMKKNAVDSARINIHKTGEIDGNLLPRYYFSSEIFKKMSETVKGKSHGMIIMLDMSGSMEGINMYFAIEQIITLVLFCQKVGIPFDVYGFADTATDANKPSFGKDNKLSVNNFWMRHLVSSMDTGVMQKKCLEMLAYAAHSSITSFKGTGQNFEVVYPDIPLPEAQRAVSFHKGIFAMSGTPLNATVIASRHVIERFKDKSGVDIVNCIYMTDGDGGDRGLNSAMLGGNKINNLYDSKYHVVDPKTRESVMTNYADFQGDIVSLIQKITGVRHVGYYIGDRYTVESKVRHAKQDKVKYAKWKKKHPKVPEPAVSLAEHGFASLPALGFDNYYYLAMESYVGAMQTSNDDLDDFLNGKKEDPMQAIVDDIVKLQGNKKSQRIVLSHFVEDIANKL